MNVEKLRKLQQWIRDEPRRYHQDSWGERGSRMVEELNPPCGTVACLGGSACLMEGYEPDLTGGCRTFSMFIISVVEGEVRLEHAYKLAKDILGLTYRQADKLFDAGALGWSYRARSFYRNATTQEARVEAACMAIDDLIADDDGVNE